MKLSLDALARELLASAARSPAGRSARTVVGGHERRLRQTVIALLAGRSLADHENPGEATVHVLRGRVRLHSGRDSWDGRTGDLLIVPPTVHALDAHEDAVVLLTALPGGGGNRSGSSSQHRRGAAEAPKRGPDGLPMRADRPGPGSRRRT